MKDFNSGVFLEYCEISKNTYYKQDLWTVASGDTQGVIVKLIKICIMKAEIIQTGLYNESWDIMTWYV